MEGKGSFFWVEETNDQTPIPMMHKRKVKPKKLEFVGWGSKSLIEFLQSIGKDTGTKLSQYDVTTIINEYVHTSSLLHPMKKKRIICDERLHSLFGKKSVPRIKIYDLLRSHFAENNDSSEDDHLYSSEEYDDLNITGKKQKVCTSEKISPYQKKKTPLAPLSHFAAVIPENIKLIYLKRRLVQELVKHPESFEGKLLGSYIRIKSDPNDYSQKNSHQLLPVTGVKNVPGIGDVHEEVLLQVPNMIKDIPISMLSDDDFSKEECEDLSQRVKDGLLKRPTVVEFQQKAQLLHVDITKDWLPRELAYLQNLIDRANEKGWRKELFEYLERRKLLQTPSEQSKLLAEVPKVTADTLEPQDNPEEHVEDIEQSNTSRIQFCMDVSLPSGEDQAMLSRGEDAAELVVGGNRELKGNGEELISFQWVEEEKTKLKNVTEVIELSDDEGKITQEKDKKEEEKYGRKWFYQDPQGKVQGPVSRNDLKLWSDAGYFMPDFKVWKDGHNPILLTDMLSGS